ncbi:MAG: DUF417 family protein [Deltaproteobacteria bacterium]|nr:MAG: DUF417 family protein [Deltaproteobacteria bacterium]
MAIGVIRTQTNVIEETATREAVAEAILRYGLVLVVAWIGAMKFTAYEAAGIQPLVANSPLMGWTYRFLSVQAFSNLTSMSRRTTRSSPVARSSSPPRSASTPSIRHAWSVCSAR